MCRYKFMIIFYFWDSKLVSNSHPSNIHPNNPRTPQRNDHPFASLFQASQPCTFAHIRGISSPTQFIPNSNNLDEKLLPSSLLLPLLFLSPLIRPFNGV